MLLFISTPSSSFFFFFNDTATTAIYTLSYTTLFRSSSVSGAMNVCPHALPRIISPTAVPAVESTPTMLAKAWRSEEYTSELQSRFDLVCRLLLGKKKKENETPY